MNACGEAVRAGLFTWMNVFRTCSLTWLGECTLAYERRGTSLGEVSFCASGDMAESPGGKCFWVRTRWSGLFRVRVFAASFGFKGVFRA